ncbi:MAG: hypothetical protein M0R77_14835 [Gammaproteobacteria bacterium]|nr:hypothetical protein [Gammaproteobacteria bacterium]
MVTPLISPGVSLSIVDDSAYSTGGSGTIPLFVVATASNKVVSLDGNAGTVAPGTATSSVLTPVASQRELIQQFGNPIFKSNQGTPIHGSELNEYGLSAAYQSLAILSSAYILRADIALEQLEPSSVEPTGPAADGTYWLNLSDTKFGIFQGNGSAWNEITPLFVAFNATTDSVTNSAGSNGNFAIDIGSSVKNLGLFEKISGTWYRVGTATWVTAKGPQALVGGGTGAVQVIYAPHTGVPPTNTVPTYHTGHIWVKTTEPNNGADYIISRYDAFTDQWSEIYAPLFATDADAIAFYTANNSLTAGVLYVQYTASNCKHVIKMFNGTSFANLDYVAQTGEPVGLPVEGTLWYNDNFQVDIMQNDGSNWIGYKNAHPNTDPNGVIFSATAPTAHSNGTALVDYDLWIDTSDLEHYPKLYRRTGGTWIRVDTSDQTTNQGIVFADARAIGGTAGLTSNLVDADRPDPKLYPAGTLLFNTRYSTGNVKSWTPGYTHEGVTIGDRWVSVSGNAEDGSPYMMRKAQRRMVVKAMQEVISSNEDIRSEFIYFNLIAAPGYPELIDEMITLNTDIKEVAFVVGDTPIRLKPDAASVSAYATNTANAAINGEDGRTGISNVYVGQYYPWGLSTNVDGTDIMVPPSAMAIRTIAYSDSVAYPWFAPAGTQRGIVTNAQSVGYLSDEGEFVRVILTQRNRDTLYSNNINPISLEPNRGILIMGQKTLSPSTTALDRINVARLVNYIRYHANEFLKPLLFQPNDEETRNTAQTITSRFLGDLLGLRALDDFAVRCDLTNNTPERIDRNELWIDVAIIPLKAVEFIYVPIRIANTGETL